jgi:rod shape-determining protein MreD
MQRQNKLDYFKLVFIIVCVFLLQIYFVPVIEINFWRPDLILIIIIFIGHKYGPMTATIVGFVLGIFQDSLSVSPIGISSFANCIIGFLAGSIREYKMKSNTAYLFTILLLLSHGFLFYLIYHLKTEATYAYFIFTRIFPNTIYTFIIWLVSSYFFKSMVEESN